MKAIILIGAFAGGLVSLVLEMAWIRSLFPVLGDVVRAAAWVVGVSLPGAAIGSVLISRRSDRETHPLRLLAMVHLGLGAGAGIALAGMGPMRHLLTTAPGGMVGTGIQCVLLFLLLLPSAFCMGGMIPALMGVAQGRGRGFEMAAGGIHFLGSAAGVALGGLLLPPLWGIRATVLGAIGVAVAFSAAIMSLHALTTVPGSGKSGAAAPEPGGFGSGSGDGFGRLSSWLAAGAGAGSAVILWVWMAADGWVFPETIVSVAVYLVGLAAGMGISGAREGRFASSAEWLCLGCLLAGSVLAATPLALSIPWMQRLPRGVLVLPSAVAMGLVWPAVWQAGSRAGARLGRLWALHALGALGGVTAGLWYPVRMLDGEGVFVVIGSVMVVIGCGLVLVVRPQRAMRLGLLLATFAVLYGVLLMTPRRGAVSPLPQETARALLAGDADRADIRNRLPVALHPKPLSVVYVGKARAPGVAAGLLSGESDAVVLLDPSSGNVRRELAGRQGAVDVVLTDLVFQEVGRYPALFTRDFYEAARRSLRPGGLCFLWIPAHRFSRDEVLRMLDTHRAVFGRVSVWRADLDSGRPVIGLAAWNGPAPVLTAGYLEDRARAVRSRLTRPNRSLQLPYGLCFLFAGEMGIEPGAGSPAIYTDDNVAFAFPPVVGGREGDRFRGEAYLSFNDRLLAGGLEDPSSPFSRDPGLTSMTRMALVAMRAGTDAAVAPVAPGAAER